MSKQDLYKRIEVIRHVEREINPDPAWVSRTRQTLLMQVSNSMPPARMSWSQRLRDLFGYLVPSRTLAAVRGPALAFLSIVSVVTGGSIASVSAAEKSVPGDLLYPVKRATEQTRLIFTKSKTDKLKLKTEFVERRGIEIRQIATSDRPQKQEQLKEAAETLRRDLDTVKLQLNEVSRQESPFQAAEAAKFVDKKSSELAITLKDVKITMSDEVRVKMAEAEVAAVNTGTKAVQVLIETQQDPEAKGVMTNAELLQSIQVKVEGLEQNIADAAHRISGATSTGSNTSTTTLSMRSTTSSPEGSANALVLSAHQSLEQTKQFLQENKLGEIRDSLVETLAAVATMEASVASVSTTKEQPLPSETVITSPSSTPSTAPSTTSSTPSSSTSTQP